MLVLSSSCGLVWPFLLISSDEQLSKFMINTKWMQKHSELKLLQNFQNFEKMNVLVSTTWERLYKIHACFCGRISGQSH